MKVYKALQEDPNMVTWHVFNSDIPVNVIVKPVYPDKTVGIPGEIAKSYLHKWMKERNREFQTVIDYR